MDNRTDNGMRIRKTAMADMERVLELYDMARRFMKEHGNPDQWGDTYPPVEMVERDIREGKSYVCDDEGVITAVFFFDKGEDPDYREIHDGAWLSDAPYSVVHRIAAPAGRKGTASFCIRWCYEKSGGNIRIDTHRDNIPMQRMLAKNGFQQCGIIYIGGTDERIAYQKMTGRETAEEDGG